MYARPSVGAPLLSLASLYLQTAATLHSPVYVRYPLAVSVPLSQVYMPMTELPLQFASRPRQSAHQHFHALTTTKTRSPKCFVNSSLSSMAGRVPELTHCM